MDEKAIRALLGIDEEADIGEAISGLQATIVAQKAVIDTDPESGEKGTLAKLRADLAAAERKALTLESETNMKIAKIERERAEERAVAQVDTWVAQGKIYPSQREMVLNFAKRDLKEATELVATLPSVDLRERGVATGHELAELEPTAEEIKVAKQLGAWDAKDPNKSRLALMKQKAADRGLTMPAEVA